MLYHVVGGFSFDGTGGGIGYANGHNVLTSCPIDVGFRVVLYVK